MTSKKESFSEKFTRFFHPVGAQKKKYAIVVLLRLYEAVLGVLTMNLLKHVTNFITEKDAQSIYLYV